MRFVSNPMQLASMAHASGMAVGGGLECNLSNWLGRFHQISKMRDKCKRDDQPGGTPSSTPGRTPRATHTTCDSSATTNTSVLTDFTNYS